MPWIHSSHTHWGLKYYDMVNHYTCSHYSSALFYSFNTICPKRRTNSCFRPGHLHSKITFVIPDSGTDYNGLVCLSLTRDKWLQTINSMANLIPMWISKEGRQLWFQSSDPMYGDCRFNSTPKWIRNISRSALSSASPSAIPVIKLLTKSSITAAGCIKDTCGYLKFSARCQAPQNCLPTRGFLFFLQYLKKLQCDSLHILTQCAR